MARLKKSRKQKKEERYCKRCGEKLEEGNFWWCEKCRRELKTEYKDADPISDYELHFLPSVIDDNGF